MFKSTLAKLHKTILISLEWDLKTLTEQCIHNRIPSPCKMQYKIDFRKKKQEKSKEEDTSTVKFLGMTTKYVQSMAMPTIVYKFAHNMKKIKKEVQKTRRAYNPMI